MHVIRWSNKFLAGLGCDHVTEKTTVRSLQTFASLTNWSKITEPQRSLWTMSDTIMFEYSIARQEFSDLTHITSKQYKDSSYSRTKRATLNITKIWAKWSSRLHFSTGHFLIYAANRFFAKKSCAQYSFTKPIIFYF